MEERAYELSTDPKCKLRRYESWSIRCPIVRLFRDITPFSGKHQYFFWLQKQLNKSMVNNFLFWVKERDRKVSPLLRLAPLRGVITTRFRAGKLSARGRRFFGIYRVLSRELIQSRRQSRTAAVFAEDQWQKRSSSNTLLSAIQNKNNTIVLKPSQKRAFLGHFNNSSIPPSKKWFSCVKTRPKSDVLKLLPSIDFVFRIFSSQHLF